MHILMILRQCVLDNILIPLRKSLHYGIDRFEDHIADCIIIANTGTQVFLPLLDTGKHIIVP